MSDTPKARTRAKAKAPASASTARRKKAAPQSAATDVDAERKATRPKETLAAAKVPVSPGLVPFLGALLAIALTALGVIGLRDAAVSWGWLGGSSWLSGVGDAADGLKPAVWTLLAGIALVIVGLWLASLAFVPRKANAVALNVKTGVFLRTNAMKRLAIATAEDVDGIVSASAKTTKKKVTVNAVSTNESKTLRDDVQKALAERLRLVNPTPRITVKLRTPGGSDS